MKIYLSEPLLDGPAWVDDLAPTPAPPARPPAAPRRQLRTWQRFLLVYVASMTAVAVILRQIVLRTGGNEAGGTFIVVLVAIVATGMAIVIFTLAGRAGRL